MWTAKKCKSFTIFLLFSLFTQHSGPALLTGKGKPWFLCLTWALLTEESNISSVLLCQRQMNHFDYRISENWKCWVLLKLPVLLEKENASTSADCLKVWAFILKCACFSGGWCSLWKTLTYLEKCEKCFLLGEEDWAVSGLQSSDLWLEQPTYCCCVTSGLVLLAVLAGGMCWLAIQLLNFFLRLTKGWQALLVMRLEFLDDVCLLMLLRIRILPQVPQQVLHRHVPCQITKVSTVVQTNHICVGETCEYVVDRMTC